MVNPNIPCSCNWQECNEWRKIFVKSAEENDPRAKPCFRVDLTAAVPPKETVSASGQTSYQKEKKQEARERMEELEKRKADLLVLYGANQFKLPITNDAKNTVCFISRHHFSLPQLKFFAEQPNRGRPLTIPMPTEEYKKLVPLVDDRAKIKDAGRPTNNCYYHLPNVPKHLVQQDIQCLLKLNEEKKKIAAAKIDCDDSGMKIVMTRSRTSAAEQQVEATKELAAKTRVYRNAVREEKTGLQEDKKLQMEAGYLEIVDRAAKRQRKLEYYSNIHNIEKEEERFADLNDQLAAKTSEISDLNARFQDIKARFEEAKQESSRANKRSWYHKEQSPAPARSRSLSPVSIYRRSPSQFAPVNNRPSRSLSPVPASSRGNASAASPPYNDDEDYSFEMIDAMISTTMLKYGGLNRFTLFDDQWHAANPKAVQDLFGFRTWAELVFYIKCFHPGLDTEQRGPGFCIATMHMVHEHSNKVTPTAGNGGTSKHHHKMCLSDFQQCVLTKLFMHSMPVRCRIAKIVGITDQRMGQIIQRWAPVWGKWGEQISILRITKEYLDRERPLEYEALGFENVAALFDGKDYLCHVRRKESKKQRSQMSNKVKAAAARDITWTTPAGLCFEYTKLFGGRISEQRLVELWGSLGNAYAPINQWRGWAQSNRTEVLCRRQKDPLPMKTALSNVDNSQLLKALYDSNDLTEDDINMEDIMDDIRDEEESAAEVNAETNADTYAVFGATTAPTEQSIKSARALIKRTLDLADERIAHHKKKAELGHLDKKDSHADSSSDIEKDAIDALKSGPTSSPLELVLQLECHERLHRCYVDGDLSECLLSFYLECVKVNRWLLLDWLGSDLTPLDYRGRCVEPPKIPLRLNTIPPGMEILGDKGFDGTDRFFPSMNPVRTPLLLRSRDVKQYLSEEIFGSDGNRALCRLRYTSEVAFSRATQVDGLKDVIHYSNICILQHLHAWGHAMMNLGNPLRRPKEITDTTTN